MHIALPRRSKSEDIGWPPALAAGGHSLVGPEGHADDRPRSQHGASFCWPEVAISVPSGDRRRTFWAALFLGGGLIAGATAAALSFEGQLRRPEITALHLLADIVVAMRFPVFPSLIVAALSVLDLDYFFVPPRYAFAWPDLASIVNFLVIVTGTAAISGVNQRLRRQRRQAANRERTMAALRQLLDSLAKARTVREAALIASRGLSEIVGGSVSILLAPCSATGEMSAAEMGDVETCWRTLSTVERVSPAGAPSIWVPLIGIYRAMGVLGLRCASPSRDTKLGKRVVAEQCAQVVASAFERIELTQAASAAKVRSAVDRIRHALLGAVSHDIVTPLASIVAASSTLEANPPEVAGDRSLLASTIVGAAKRLTRLNDNLVMLSRLRTGLTLLQREMVPVDQLVDGALARMREGLDGRPINFERPQACPLVSVDRRLIEKALGELLEFASRQSAGDEPIDVTVDVDGPSVTLGIGHGGPDAHLDPPRNRNGHDGRGSDADAANHGGLGFIFASVLVESHGGRLWWDSRDAGGAIARLRLERASLPL